MLRTLVAQGALAALLVGAAVAHVDSKGAPSEVVLLPGPDYAQMHSQGWATIHLDESSGAVRLDVVGIPGGSTEFGDVLVLANLDDEPRNVWVRLASQGEIRWALVGPKLQWSSTNASSPTPIVLDAGEQVVLSLVLDWQVAEAPAHPLHVTVLSRPVSQGEP